MPSERCKFYENGIWNRNRQLTRNREDLMARESYIWLYETPRSVIGVKIADSNGNAFVLHQWVFNSRGKCLSKESDWTGQPIASNRANDSSDFPATGCEDHSFCDTCSECIDCDDCNCWTCSGCDRRISEDDTPRCERCEDCERCCECAYCESCNHRVESTCSNCERCTGNCCECIYCEGCGENTSPSGYCGSCERCEGCGCQCESEGPRYRQKFKIEKPANLKGYRVNRLKRPISIELELSEVGDNSELIDWARQSGGGLVEDRSIPESGCEINTNPTAGDLFIDAIAKLARALSRANADTNTDCGFHVHVDASDYSQYDLRRLIMLWSIVERAMFDLAGKSRIENTYCKPASGIYVEALNQQNARNSKIFRSGLARSLYECTSSSVKECKQDRYNGARYHAMNLHSFFFRKTIEFRLHEAKTDAPTLRNWPLVCAHIVDFALKQTERQLKALVCSSLSSGEVLAMILPNDLNVWVTERLQARYEARQAAGTYDDMESKLASLDRPRQALQGILNVAVQQCFNMENQVVMEIV